MALSDKDILITPNSGSSTDDPQIKFTGATSGSASTITASILDLDGGTLSFEGSSGQLFSITNSLTGSIFSANDVSGVPSIDVNSDGTILLAPFESSPLIGIGKTNPEYALDVEGDIKLADTGTIWFDDTSGTVEKIVGSGSAIDIYADAEVRFFESDASTEKVSIDVNNARIFFQEDDNTYWYRPAADTHAWTTAGTERFRIDSTGNAIFNSSYVTFGGSAVGASEGGEIRLTSPTAQSNGDTVIDMNGVNLRFFYANTPFKGAYLPLSSLGDAVASRILTTSDEGSGNGLDADTLDGVQGSSFLRTDANTTKTAGELLLNDSIPIRFGTGGDAQMFHNGSDMYFDFQVAGDSWYFRDSSDSAIFAFAESTGDFSLYKGSVLVGDGGDQSTVQIKKADNNASDHIEIYNGTTLVGQIGCQDTTWFRINQGVAKNIYTPRMIRADDGFQLVDSKLLRFGSASDALMFYDGTNNDLEMELESACTDFLITDNGTTRFTFTKSNGNFTATGNVTAFSDINIKKNIEVIPNALDKVSKIRGVTFDRIDIEDEPRQSGVIAQEVEKVLPEVVSTTKDGMKTVAYGNLVGLLIESIKELKEEVETLKAERN